VLTPTAVISVRGTTFDISVEDEDETTLVEVEEGLVEVQHALLPRGNAKMLSAGESIRVYKNEPLAASLIDKGDLFRRVFHAALDAATTIATRTPRLGGIGGGSGPGDVKKAPPPPPPPALPPPAPGHLVASGSDDTVQVQAPAHESRIHKVTHLVWRFVSVMFFDPTPHIDIR